MVLYTCMYKTHSYMYNSHPWRNEKQRFLKMFEKSDPQKKSFLEQTKSARIIRRTEREGEEKQNTAIIIIQKNVRGFVARSKFNKKLM